MTVEYFPGGVKPAGLVAIKQDPVPNDPGLAITFMTDGSIRLLDNPQTATTCEMIVESIDGSITISVLQNVLGYVIVSAPPYSAKRDGSTVDRAALNSANTAAGVNGTLFFP